MNPSLGIWLINTHIYGYINQIPGRFHTELKILTVSRISSFKLQSSWTAGADDNDDDCPYNLRLNHANELVINPQPADSIHLSIIIHGIYLLNDLYALGSGFWLRFRFK